MIGSRIVSGRGEITRAGRDQGTRAVVIGVGNPVLTDDGVGLQVAREVRRVLGHRGDVDVVELAAGGLSIMEACLGYDRAIVVDAMTGGGTPGSVYRLSPAELNGTNRFAGAHRTDLGTALDVGRFLGMPVPPRIDIWGIEPEDILTFGEELTPRVANAVPEVVGDIVRCLGR